jgi:3-oxoacyl-[acyl-carrier protein] reductase
LNHLTKAQRRVLITGSSRGIGKAIAIALAEDGFAVAVNARHDSPALRQVCDEISGNGGTVTSLAFDVANRESALQLIEADINANGAYYGVIVNAGLHRDGAFPALSDRDWDEVIGVNLDGFYNVVKPCVMPMIRLRNGGRIIVISSISGSMGNRGQVNYSAAKAGLMGAAKALAVELATRKITVNCIAPGIIESDMSEDVPEEMIRTLVPMQRRGKDSEVAGLARYLMSDMAGYVTRQVISINGGMA